MKLQAFTKHKFFRPAIGAVLAVCTGLALWSLSPGEAWVSASYDNLFRFGSPRVTNNVVVVFMDNDAYRELAQDRDRKPPWDRNLYAQLLNKLADDACPLVAMDVRFNSRGENEIADKALIAAMARNKNLVLAASQAGSARNDMDSATPSLPLEDFLQAAHTNWGVAWFDLDNDSIVRRHWPFPSPGPYESLPWALARISGTKLSSDPVSRWIRYYRVNTGWTGLSFHHALGKGRGYFRDKVVFIGSKPATTIYDNEKDEFCAPYLKWTNETCGGVELLATCYLNLVNNEWLERPSWFVELLTLIFTGSSLGFGLSLSRFRRGNIVLIGIVAAFILTLSGVCLSFFTNYWFPWLVVVGGQIPCTMAWAIFTARPQLQAQSASQPAVIDEKAGKPAPDKTFRIVFAEEQLPEAPEYEIITPEVGRGGFGKVWIVKNAIGQWQALKAVYESNFNGNRGPYEAEFKGLQRYKPVSEKHPGLLRIDLVSTMKKAGYFYYIMELGDAQSPGWEKQPTLYKPKDLENMRKQAFERRLPVADCVRIVTVLADALNFLHEQGLTHRDIKPSNVIFVNGRPKLADIGLVADIRPLDQVHTFVGTLGYMPPPPEKPGTTQADIYALGMLLYVISSGNDPGLFPDISTALMERSNHADFPRLNSVILKACQPSVVDRYQTTVDMLRDLQLLAPQ